MDLESVILSEVSQTEKDIPYMGNLKIHDTNELNMLIKSSLNWNRNKLTDLENKLVVAKAGAGQGGLMGESDREFGMDMYTLL